MDDENQQRESLGYRYRHKTDAAIDRAAIYSGVGGSTINREEVENYDF